MGREPKISLLVGIPRTTRVSSSSTYLFRAPELLALIAIGALQGLSVATSVPRIMPTGLALLISVGLLLARRGESLLLLGIGTMTIVSYEPAPCDVFFGLYILYACTSTPMHETLEHWQRLPGWARWALYVYLVLNVVIVLVNPSFASVRFAAITFYLIALFVAVATNSNLGALASAFPYAYFLSFVFVLASVFVDAESFLFSRFQGWFKDPNVLAAYTIPAMLYLFALVVSGQNYVPRYSWALAATGLVVLTALLLWTASRGALVSLLPGIALLLVIYWKSSRWRAIVGIAIVALSVVTFEFSPDLFRKLSDRQSLAGVQSGLDNRSGSQSLVNLRNQIDSSGSVTPEAQVGARNTGVSRNAGEPADDDDPGLMFVFERFSQIDHGRLNTYQAGLKAALEYPLGVGPGNYEQYAVRFADQSRPYAHAAHSLYLRTWVEQGALGLIALLLFLGSSFVLIIRQASFSSRVSRPDTATMAAVAASLASMYANSFIIDTLHWRHLWLILGIGVGAVISSQPR